MDLFSVTWEIILLYFLRWNFMRYWQKNYIKVQVSRLATAHIKIHQIPHVIFETFFKLYITLQCHETWCFCTFSSKYLNALEKQIQSKCKFSDFQLLAWKLTKFLVIFQATSQFLFKLSSTLQCHDTQFLWNFLIETVYAFDKKSPSLYNFQTFGCSNESSPSSSCHFWKYRVRVYSKFATLFSVVKDNSSVFF